MRWKAEKRQEESEPQTRDTSLSLSLQLFHETRGPPWSSNNSRNLLIPARTTMSSTWRERLSNTFLPALIRIRRSSARIKRSSSRNDALSSREDDWECGEKEMATIYGKGKGGRKEREKKRKWFLPRYARFRRAPRQCTADGDRRKLLRGRLNDVNVDISL